MGVAISGYLKILSLAVLVLVVVGLVIVGVRGMAIVEGRSMEPLFHTGDVVFLEKKNPGEIKIGDIIVYESLDGKYIIHRIIGVYEAGGLVCYVVKGDNNPIPDPGVPPCPLRNGVRGVPYSRIKGVVVSVDDVPVKIPYLGGLTLLLRG
ncbi:MAG: signal peptidase I [Desulfurococcales archaeon]|nr:signal peptidase I [Desulfurococcales archaeon]